MVKTSLMYEGVETVNPFVGCNLNCLYCYARSVAKRSKWRCPLHGTFEPHLHPERLMKPLKKGATYFLCSLGEIACATNEQIAEILAFVARNKDTTCLLQTKDPSCLNGFGGYIPDNLIVGTTLETAGVFYSSRLFGLPELYPKYPLLDITDPNWYAKISKAPSPEERYKALRSLKDKYDIRTYVAVEPAFETDVERLVQWILLLRPERVYVGQMNHFPNLILPELEYSKLCKLLSLLDRALGKERVFRKTIQSARWEVLARSK